MKRFISTLLALCMILPMTVFASSDEQSQIAALLQEALPRAIARGAFALPEGTDPDALYLTDEIPMYRYVNGSYQRKDDISVYMISSASSVLGTVYVTESGFDFGVNYAPTLQTLLSTADCTQFVLISRGESLFCQLSNGQVYPLSNPRNISTPAPNSSLDYGSVSPTLSIGIISNQPTPAVAIMLSNFPIVQQNGVYYGEYMLCTVASTTAVINYKKGTSYSVLDIAEDFGYVLGSNSGAFFSTARLVLLNYGIGSTITYSTLSTSTVMAHIMYDKPIIVASTSEETDEEGNYYSHATVVCGYESTGNAFTYYYMDPEKTSLQTFVTYQNVSFRFASSSGMMFISDHYLSLN